MKHIYENQPNSGIAAPAPKADHAAPRGRRRRARLWRPAVLAAAAGLSVALVLVYAVGSAVVVMTMFSPAAAEPAACSVRAGWPLIDAVDI